MTRLRPPAQHEIADPETDRAVKEHARLLGEIVDLPGTGVRIIKNVTLANATDTPIAHGLGRAPAWVRESCPRGATATGRVTEVRSTSYKRDRFVVLRADGHGATITVDVWVA